MHSNRFISLNSLLALLAAICLQTPRPAGAATPVCGLVEAETWTPAGSPYLVTCDVQVDSLVVQPGVTVQFESNYVFQVTGFLMATGAVFTTTNSAGWQGIFFNEVAPLSALDSCTIEGSINSGVRIKNCLVRISDCTFRNNSAGEGGGINIDNALAGLGQLAIVGCTFSNNMSSGHGGGVRANVDNNSIRFVSCAIVNNTAASSVSSGNYVGGGLHITGNSSFDNCVIAGNVVSGCTPSGVRDSRGGGMHLDGNGSAILRNCIITNNAAEIYGCVGGSGRNPYAYGGAIFLGTGTLTARNCVIAYNRLSGSINFAYGGAVWIDSNSEGALFENCTFAYNRITNSNTSDGGAIYAADTATVRNSIIFFNDSGGTQLAGTADVTYSDVQGVVLPGPGNRSVNPNLGPLTANPATCLRINLSSACVDMGDPDPIYNDICFPPSRGTALNDMGAHGGPGACCWDAPCECPVLSPLQGQVVCAGMSATLCIAATGADALSFQWRSHGAAPTNAPVNIAGATNSCLVLNSVQTNNAGYYSVRVSNPSCSVESNPALLLALQACFSLDLYPGLSITGQVGRTYCVQYTPDLSSNPVWTSLTNFTLITPDYFYRDPQPARRCEEGQVALPQRFYRVIEGACP